MTIREQMLQAAKLAVNPLSDAADLVVEFIGSEMNDDGGFKGLGGNSDLYYTVFGLEGLGAMQAELPVERIAAFLRTFGGGETLDFIHLTCLARCWANLPDEFDGRREIVGCIERYRADDGGYGLSSAAKRGTAYGCFLALGAYQDLKTTMPDVDGLIRCVESLAADDGGYANEPALAASTTPSTAAAVTVLRNLGRRVDERTGRWLMDRFYVCGTGGFVAGAGGTIPDLLSTATALHALACMDVSFDTIKEPCLDFIDSLWTGGGGFCGNWAQTTADCEYTYYGLLALGHLS